MKTRITIALLFFAIVSQAQVQRLSLKDALKYALENKADAKKAKLEVENSNHKIAEVRSRALPQISLNGSLTYNPILQLNALPGDFFGQPGTTILAPLGQKWNSVGGASLTQNIFDYSVFTGLKAAKSTREFYQVNAQLTEEQVIEKVANAYYQVFVQKQKLNTIDSTLENTTKVRNIIDGQFKNGLAKKIDLDRVNVKLINLNSTRQQLVNGVQMQENSLKFLIGLPASTPIEIVKEDIQVKPFLNETPSVTNRSEYQLLEKQKTLLKYQKESFVAEHYPTLSLTANYNYIGQGPVMPLGAKPADGVYWSDFSAIGLNLRIPVFTGFATRSKVRQADISLQKIEEDLKDSQLALGLEFENAKSQLNNSLITINNQKENVTLAQEVFSNTKNNYVNGLASLTDLLDAENALTEAKNNYTSALLEYKLAEIQIIKSKGELKTLLNQ
ncbi:TolC family protein [Flavobacterium supellecticarium]|uniref:TolC family protein n=1 Tax=Flavobacterium supellecticarium TaxID=2565924 RepID=A0A4S3ZS99_9FLAO|nr:TolC family protein [Flavobacterium supellecticarium]THF48434.1 TolC family protein [Flavobacterium supellecticarium]